MVRLLKWGFFSMLALGLLGVAWWLGAQAWAWVAGILGLGVGGKVLQEYVRTEREQQEQQAQDAQRHQAELALLEAQQKASREHWQQEQTKASCEAQQKAKAADTHDKLQSQQDEAIESFSKWLDEQGGFARSSTKWLMLLVASLWLVMMQLWTPGEAVSRAPTSQEKQRAARLFEVLQKARITIKRLKETHRLSKKRAALQCEARLRQKEFMLRKERKQKQLLATTQRCPTQWPLMALGGLVGLASMGLVWGVVEWHRAPPMPGRP